MALARRDHLGLTGNDWSGSYRGRQAAPEHIVQSALSQQVRRLERDLGARLLESSTHHVSLTAAGAVFLAEARQILARWPQRRKPLCGRRFR